MARRSAATHTDMQHVIYKETSMLYAGVANGELNFALGTLATAGPLQRAGKIKFIAVTAPKRHSAFLDVPKVAESGGPAGSEMTGWTTLAAPKSLPKAVADKIRKTSRPRWPSPTSRTVLRPLATTPSRSPGTSSTPSSAPSRQSTRR